MSRVQQVGCSFCREFNAASEESRFYNLFHGEIKRRFLWETENFVVVPGIGHLQKGYVLIRSKDHYQSIAFLPLNLTQELAALRLDVITNIETIFGGNIICFEHGAVAPDLRGAACTEHLHLHILPCPSLRPTLREAVNLRPVEDLSSLGEYVARREPYILYGERTELFSFESQYLPKQFMRRRVAAALGRPGDWDWREGVNERGQATEPEIIETVKLIEQHKKKS
ncbi:HIT family protein [Rhizobium leguminosarum]|uniref:HIT family protein n=1 Tax=Rhizobium leguminosarum TaxID=384 RepID=UPI001F37E36D|nr:hypothetical protein [Rhizobium leguminosarum]UIJ83174.1 hypothetical protein LZK78_32370 [Rhizobium leguminosarum]